MHLHCDSWQRTCRIGRTVAHDFLSVFMWASPVSQFQRSTCDGVTFMLQDDMAETQAWFTSPSLKDSWQAWNKEWVDVVSNASGKQMGRLATCIRAHLVKLPTVLLLIGAVYRFDVRQGLPMQKFAVMLAVSGEPFTLLRHHLHACSCPVKATRLHHFVHVLNMCLQVLQLSQWSALRCTVVLVFCKCLGRTTISSLCCYPSND